MKHRWLWCSDCQRPSLGFYKCGDCGSKDSTQALTPELGRELIGSMERRSRRNPPVERQEIVRYQFQKGIARLVEA